LNLNHGSYGAVPRSVMKYHEELLRRVESSPDRWFRLDSERMYKRVRGRLAGLLNARVENVVPVTNATLAANCVLKSQGFGSDDIIMVLEFGYPAFNNAAHASCERYSCRCLTIHIDFPITCRKQVTDAIRAFLDKTPDHRRRLLVVDHISSSPGIELPVKDIVEVCHKRNVLVFVDGAHAIGQIDIDVGELGCDYYTTNCHKWLYGPKGCALLWAKNHKGLTSVITGHGWHGSYFDRFWMQGTRDLVPFFAVEASLDFIDRVGGLGKIQTYNRALLQWSLQTLTTRWGTDLLCDPSMHVNMGLVRMPWTLPPCKSEMDCPEYTKATNDLMLELLDKHKICVAICSFRGVPYCRISVQIYTSKDDILDFANFVEKRLLTV